MSTFELWIRALLSPIDATLSPSQRVFWPALAISVGLTAVVAWQQGQPVLRSLFPKRIWLHRSALLDYQLMVAKALIRLVLVAPWMVSALALTIEVITTLNQILGPSPGVRWASWQISALYTVTLFVAWDLSRYVLHRLMHEVPMLWELHKVHHSARVLTPFTLYRSHPVESVLYALRGVCVTALVTGGFFYVFGERAVAYEFLGVNALGFGFNLLGANLRHSHVWITYGRWVERILISPAQHQLHHSRAPEHWGSNYGSWLAVWDGLGGTLRLAQGRPRLRFGLAPRDANHHPYRLSSALLQPLWAAGQQLRRVIKGPTARWKVMDDVEVTPRHS